MTRWYKGMISLLKLTFEKVPILLNNRHIYIYVMEYPYVRSYSYLLFSYHLICFGVYFFTTVKIEARAFVYLECFFSQRGKDSVCPYKVEP